MHVAERAFAPAPPALTELPVTISRDETLSHYRMLRQILISHNNLAFDFVGKKAALEHAKRLGLGNGKQIFADGEPAWALIMDFALYACKQGRSRAIDRYAHAAQPADADSARMLRAMCASVFSVWQIERRHGAAGLILADLWDEDQVWLMDEGLEESSPVGSVFAARLCLIDGFAMTTGLVLPLIGHIIEDVLLDSFSWPDDECRSPFEQSRVATAVCRAAVEGGMLDRIMFR
jgi:hypothetical protein